MDESRHRLALIELLERDGRVRRSVEVRRWPVTLGRGLDCDIVLEDPHVAARHVVLQPDAEGLLHLTVGATRNGVQVGPRTAVEGESVPVPRHGEAWQIGATRLRVRLPDDEVEAERPLDLGATGARVWTTLLAALALWGLVLALHAVDLDPGSSLNEWLVPLIGVPAAAAGWSLAWASASRIFQHRFEFWAHFAVLVKGGLAYVGAGLLLPLLAFMLSWEWLSRITPAVQALIAAATVLRHAMLAAPVRSLWLVAGIGGVTLLAGLVMGTLNYQRSGRVFAELYLATLPPPVFRLAPGVTPKEFAGEVRELQQGLQREVARETD